MGGYKEAERDLLKGGTPEGNQKEVMSLGADSAGEIHLVLGPGPECLPTLACSRTPNILATRAACGVRNTHRELTAVIEIDDGLCWPVST